MAFAQTEPIGAERADLQAAIIACTMANINRSSKQSPYKIGDFMPKFDGPVVQTVDEMKAICKGLMEWQ